MLILGALSGIQDYVFDVPEAGGGQGRRLRGRSFLVQVVAEAAMLRLLRILRLQAHDLKLVPSVTVYMRWGKAPKKRLRFTKSGDPKLEEAYARHFGWPEKDPSHTPARKETSG